MKKLLVLIAILSLTAVACDAFKDNYGNAPATSGSAAASAKPPANAAGGGGAAPAEVGGGAVDYITDATECKAVEGVTVAKSDKAGAVTKTELSIAEDGAELKTVAEKVGDFTTKIVISIGDKEALSLIIKQTGEKEFSVCSISHEGKKVKGGSITIDRFNEKSDKGVLNAGAFKLEFEDDEGAVTVMKALSGADGSAVEGTYFAEALSGGEKKE